MIINDEEYLGDAVFASFDGYQIRLRCAAPECVIYLESNVLEALFQYVERVMAQAETAS